MAYPKPTAGNFVVRVKSAYFIYGKEEFSKRSKVLAEYIRKNPTRAFSLDLDQDMFVLYIRCVLDGAQAIEKFAAAFEQQTPMHPDGSREKQEAADAAVFVKLIDFYNFVVDGLDDEVTSNMAIDEIVRFSDIANVLPGRDSLIRLSLGPSFGKPSPQQLFDLLKRFWAYDILANGGQRFLRLNIGDNDEFKHAVGNEVIRFIEPNRQFRRSVKKGFILNKCRYHHHENTERCVPDVDLSDDEDYDFEEGSEEDVLED